MPAVCSRKMWCGWLDTRPNDEALVGGPANDAAVPMKADTGDPAVVTHQHTQLLPMGHIPHPHRGVIATAHQQRAIGIEGDRAGLPVMPHAHAHQRNIAICHK